MEGNSAGNIIYLPNELVVEILSRLPVKSLLRFKCVCKSWLSIITHPQFIKTHLCRSTESPNCRRLLLKTKPLSFTFLSFDFETPNHESKSLQCPFENSDSNLQALCSCDGLILVSIRDGLHLRELETPSRNCFVLWNPSIRSYKRISCPYELPFSSLYGLCYDSVVADYRVFIVSQENETSVVVYHLRNDSWNIFIDNRYVLSHSRIDSWNIFIDNRYVLSSSKHQAVVNGAVHWVMSPYDSVSSVIVYFDLVEEKFKEVPPPSSWNKDDEMNLVVLGEHLCVYGDIGVKQIEVYAMKEYGKKESWTRLFVIPCGILESIHSSTDVKPLCLTKNDQVLMSVEKRGVGIYDPEDYTFLVYDCDRGWMPMPYVETLVSLPSKTNGITLISTPPPPSNSAPPPPPLPPPPQTQPWPIIGNLNLIGRGNANSLALVSTEGKILLRQAFTHTTPLKTL